MRRKFNIDRTLQAAQLSRLFFVGRVRAFKTTETVVLGAERKENKIINTRELTGRERRTIRRLVKESTHAPTLTSLTILPTGRTC